MTKSELIARLSTHFPHLVHRDSQIAVDLILDAIGDALCKGRRVEMRGFGSFSVHYRLPRVARNPKSGEPVPVLDKYVPHFKPGQPLLGSLHLPNGLEPLQLAA